jgi:integrase
MPKLQRNVRVIASAIAGPKMVYQIDGAPGLNLAALGGGKASWRLRYRPSRGAEKRWHTIGDARMLALGDAIDKARGLISALQIDGIDPKADLERPAELTFGLLFLDWMERHAKVKKKSWLNDEQMYNRHIAQRLGDRAVSEISRRDVIAALGEIAAIASGIQANRAQSLISAVFTWAVAMEFVENHPALRIPKHGIETPRERVWTHGELKILWHALVAIIAGDHRGPISPQMARLIMVLLLTGQRRSEVAHATANEVTLNMWCIPAARMKGKRPHVVPLASIAAMQFADALSCGMPDGYVFPGRSGGKIDPLSVGKALDRINAVLGIDGAKVHDLRRTMASEMGRLGVPEETISRVLAHAKAGVTARHYNLYAYDTEKRAAFELWESELMRIVSVKALT